MEPWDTPNRLWILAACTFRALPARIRTSQEDTVISSLPTPFGGSVHRFAGLVSELIKTPEDQDCSGGETVPKLQDYPVVPTLNPTGIAEPNGQNPTPPPPKKKKKKLRQDIDSDP